MFRALSLVSVAMVCVCLGGCKTDHESIMKDSVSKYKELVSIMKGVTDESSAKAASPKIEAIADDLKKLQEEAKKLGDPSKEKQEELMKKYQPEMMSAMGDMMKEAMRIGSDPKLRGALDPAMKKLPSGM